MATELTPPTAIAGISPAQAVGHALKLLASNPAQAEHQAKEILKFLPDDARAVFIIGAARRRAGHAQAAREVLEPLAKLQPNSAYTQHEFGLVLADLGESEASIAALRRATELQRGLAEYWLSLSDQQTLNGEGAAAVVTFAEVVRLSSQDPGLLAATAAFCEGRLRESAGLLRPYLEAHPEDALALRLMADAAARLGHRDDAEELIARCVELEPGWVGARHNYAVILWDQSKTRDAIVQIERVLASAPLHPKCRALLSGCHAYVGEYARAIEILEALLAEHPTQVQFWLSYGQSLRILGRREEAVRAFRRAIALNPTHGESYWSLVDLKTERLSDEEVAVMQSHVEDTDLTAAQRLHLHYALGKALEDAGEWTESFAHYARGAALRLKEIPYQADRHSAWVAKVKAHFTPEFFAERPDGGSPDPAPIFVVGLPRSGSTLVEQILAAHSQIESTMELPNLIHLSARLGRAGRKGVGPNYEQVLTELTPEACRALGEEYIERARAYRKSGKPFFVDKMPSNCFHVGLIKLILPKARIIDVRRHPMAACFASFKQHFFRGQDFTYDLGDLARYYRDYLDIMAHFDAVLPGFVHRVIYEDLVEDTEAEVRRLLKFCGVPFEPATLRFWENAGTVSTHSSEQVRRPIFRDGLDLWKHYGPWLEPLRAALGPALETWRGGADKPEETFENRAGSQA